MKKNKKGFTLAELLIVVAIIGVLVAIAIPIFTSQLEKSREATDLANVRSAYAQVMVDANLGITDTKITVQLKQKRDYWQSSSNGTVTIGGITHSATGDESTDNWNGNARANTMFKLTYQAYIMFGMTMIYAIFRLLVIGKNKILKVLAFIGLFSFVWTCGYFGNSVHSWFGEVWKPSQYKGLNATAFLETDFPEDVNGIRWLKENISDAPVVLEANGDSYSEYERVSAMTGLPTIMGWYVHEWLWRGNLSDLNAKIEEIQEIYTSTDETRVKELLEEYNVSYIFVGSCERNKYGADMNNDLLKSLGEVVFQDSEYPTYIVKIN